MSTALFALPFNGRCLSPNPEPAPRRFETGCRVCWIPDREEGTVVGLTLDAVAIEWDESEYCVYPLCGGAVRDRIAVLEQEGWL
jgi:hypothetical protein